MSTKIIKIPLMQESILEQTRLLSDRLGKKVTERERERERERARVREREVTGVIIGQNNGSVRIFSKLE